MEQPIGYFSSKTLGLVANVEQPRNDGERFPTASGIIVHVGDFFVLLTPLTSCERSRSGRNRADCWS